MMSDKVQFLLDTPSFKRIKRQTHIRPDQIACVEYWLPGDHFGDVDPSDPESGLLQPGEAHIRFWVFGYPCDMSCTVDEAREFVTALGIEFEEPQPTPEPPEPLPSPDECRRQLEERVMRNRTTAEPAEAAESTPTEPTPTEGA